MKKIFTFLVAFLATMSGAVWGQSTYDATLDISGNSATVTGSGISVSGNHIEIEGDGNYLIKGNGQPADYYIVTNDDPTITLENVYLKHEGDPIIEINTALQNTYVTFILSGKNIFESEDEIGIRNTVMAHIIISNQSTGSLTLNTDIGFGTGNLGGVCGDVAVNGGTVIFDTKTAAIDGSPGESVFTMNGSGVVITNQKFYDINYETADIESGIIFDNSADWNTGHTGFLWLKDKESFTLNSPLDLTDNNLTATLNLQGGKLVVGNGQILKANEKDITNGSIVGFAVKYKENRIRGCASAGSVSSDFNFYGTQAPVILPAALTCSTGAGSEYGHHQFLGWADDSKVTAAETEYTTSITANTYTASAAGEITGNYLTLKGAWAVNELTLNVANHTPMIAQELASTPDFISYGTISDGLPTGISFNDYNNNTFSGTPDVSFGENEQTKTFIVNVPVIGSGVTDGTTATIKIVVSKDKHDLSKATVSVSSDASSYVYNNDRKYPLDVEVEGLETPLVEGTHYTVIYGYKAKEGDTEEEVTEVTEAGTYTVKSITATDLTANSVSAETIAKLNPIIVSPRTLNVTVQDQPVDNGTMPTLDATTIVVTDNTNEVNDYWATGHSEAAITFSGTWNPATVPALAGKYTLTTTDLSIASVTLDGDQTHNYKLGKVTPGVLTVSISGDDDKPINPGTPDEDGDDDGVIIQVSGDGWTVADGAYQHVYIGDGFTELLRSSLEAKQVKEDGTDDWITIPADAVTDVEVISYNGETTSTDEVKNAGFYFLQITLDANKAEGLLYDGVVRPLPVRITPRDLSINFPLDDITEEQIGKELDPNDLYWEDVTKGAEDAGLVDEGGPRFSGYIRIAGTANEDGKYDVYYKLDIEDEGTGDFLKINYNPSVSINDTEIALGEEGENQLPEGIEVDSDDDDDNTGGGIISTKRYRLYLANQDYLNTGDYKKYYDELGLVLHSRHNQKYTTNTDKSFTIWYTQDGEVNAGGFRVFMSNHANGEYKEVKLDEVSGYYQIRNVTSNVYVKLCWSNGHPVANEDITATDARAYAQPNKIVVITPQPTDVQIISMAGAVVATDKVTGQREFANLTEGVYIVRMGETVVKLQVRK